VRESDSSLQGSGLDTATSASGDASPTDATLMCTGLPCAEPLSSYCSQSPPLECSAKLDMGTNSCIDGYPTGYTVCGSVEAVTIEYTGRSHVTYLYDIASGNLIASLLGDPPTAFGACLAGPACILLPSSCGSTMVVTCVPVEAGL
jgi:hypothetical protein